MTPEPSSEYQKLVEAVARAIMLHHDIDPDVFKGMNGGYGHWIDCARAALSALKLPHAGDEGWQDIATARERFLDLIADASEFDEQQDECGIYYTLKFTDDSLVPLMNALGLVQKHPTLIVDGEPLPCYESPAEALSRYIDEALPTPPAGVSDNG